MPTLRRMLAAAIVMVGCAWAAPGQAASCSTGFSPRFTVKNNCGTDVWMIETAPGSTLTQPTIQGQWSWLNQYATQFGSLVFGTGSINAGSTLLTWNVPGTLPVAGVTITVAGAGPSGAPLTTTIQSASAASAMLDAPAGTTVTNASLSAPSGQAAVLLPAGQAAAQAFCVPNKGAPGGNFRFYMGCPNGNTEPFSTVGCTIGAATGPLSGVDTLFEPTFGCDPTLSGTECAFNPGDPATACQSDPNSTNCSAIASTDNMDISAVNGYTMPMSMTVSGGGASCNRATTDASMLDLASCPSETRTTLYSTDSTQQSVIQQGISLLSTDPTSHDLKGCVAPLNFFFTSTLGAPTDPAPSDPGCSPVTSACFYAAAGCNTSAPTTQCPCGSGPQQKVGPQANGQFAIQNTNWVQGLFAMGYAGYTWQYGDGVGDQSCTWGGTIALTLCPNGGTPYSPNVLWTFSATTGTCSAAGTGTPDGTTTFGSLGACQQANMRYTCQDLTQTDPFHIASAMWSADPAATLAGTGSTWTDVQAQKPGALQCGSLTVQNIPSGACSNPGGTMQLAECNYLYGTNGAACPTPAAGVPIGPSPFPVAFQIRKGKADHVGIAGDQGKIQIDGRFQAPRGIRLDQATLTVWRLLSEVGAIELARGGNQGPLQPVTLTARPGSTAVNALYETAPGQHPSIRITVSTSDPRSLAMMFSAAVSDVTIDAPARCAGPAPSNTTLQTRFTLDDGAGSPVQVDAKLAWTCGRHELDALRLMNRQF